MSGVPPCPSPEVEAQHLLQLIFDHSGEGISVFDAGLRLRAFNARFLELTGVDPALARPGTPLQTLLLAQARAGEFGDVVPEAEVLRRLQTLRDHPVATSERRRPDGRTIELRRRPTPDGGFIGLYTDISERKATQARLDDQQRMLSLLIAHTEQGIWFIDNEQRTTDANPAMCRMLGLPLEQLRGRSIYDFVDEANAAVLRERVRRRSEGRAEGYELTLRRADGAAVDCFNNATPIHDAAGCKVGAVGMLSDITALKRSEQLVRHTGELLAQKTRVLEVTLDCLSQGVLSVDAQGRTSAFNRRFLDLLQIPESFMQQRPTLQQIREWQMAMGHIPHDDRVVGGAAWRSRAGRYRRRTANGLVLEVRTHFADDGSITRTYTDVTADASAQQALQRSESRFRGMADAAPAFIWQAQPDGRPLWFNQRWLDITGRTLQAELALDWSHRIHASDLPHCIAVFGAAKAAQTGFEAEFRGLGQGGATVWIADHGIAHFGADGAFDGFVVYGWDITGRKCAEAALIAAKEEAERANRAKSEFLSRMSHELRTPLNAVLGFAQLMETDASDPLSASQRARVQELQRGGRHLLRLISDVLDLARIESGTLQLQVMPLEPSEVLRDCLRLVQPVADQRGVLLDAQPGPWPRVLADPVRLKQVLLNLLSNAIKYNRRGGRVRVVCQPHAQALRIEVQDTGPGLSLAQQEKLFHAFERLDAERGSVEGAGIGLALSKWLVELMKGRIGADSAPGQGSVFWFTLETATAAAASAALALQRDPALLLEAGPAAAVDPGRPPLTLRSVLYIEDNEVNRLLMEGMLAQRPDLRLRMAALPLEGLAMAQQDRPDLLLMDIQLPGMDGFEVLRRLREHEARQGLPPLPAVAVSANAMPADREKAEQAGFADCVTKPIDLRLLLAAMARLLPR